jgi:prevent-host-death family protein
MMKIAPVATVKAKFSAYLKASEDEPIIVTRNGKPVAVILGVSDEEELEKLLLAHSPRLKSLLESAKQRIDTTGGLPHDAFWNAVESESK